MMFFENLQMAFIHYGIAIDDSIQDYKKTAEVKEVIGKVDSIHSFFWSALSPWLKSKIYHIRKKEVG